MFYKLVCNQLKDFEKILYTLFKKLILVQKQTKKKMKKCEIKWQKH